MQLQCLTSPKVERIWGPPGTGKTSTLASMLVILIGMKRKALVCTPTNAALLEIATRVHQLIEAGNLPYKAELILFGRNQKLKAAENIIGEIFKDHKEKLVKEILDSRRGFLPTINEMDVFLSEKVSSNDSAAIQESYIDLSSRIRKYIDTIRTHFPKTIVKEESISSIIENIDYFDNILTSDIQQLQFLSETEDFTKHISATRENLRKLQSYVIEKLPANSKKIPQFLFENASILFSTTSSSSLLSDFHVEDLSLLVIDEAAQVQEIESMIPLQLDGIMHVILVGDEQQLPALVRSKVSRDCGLGRSLFERLNHLEGYSKHLLDTQYRMHPQISLFPNKRFYDSRIIDAEVVKGDTYRKIYLEGNIFGAFSFIDVSDGIEERGDNELSYKNKAEARVVVSILEKLSHSEYWNEVDTSEKISVGVISPYRAQVSLLIEELADIIAKFERLSIDVSSVDTIQGREADIIVISVVRCNEKGKLGFTCSEKRTNVALTRARHSLWIVGNKKTLLLHKGDSVWKGLIEEAVERGCCFNAKSL